MKTKRTSFHKTSQVTRAEKLHSLIPVYQGAAPILAGRIAFPLLLITAWMVIVQPSPGQTGTWLKTGSLSTERYSHAATLLPDGKVLVSGGMATFFDTTIAELYDPASETWSTTGSLAKSRDGHTATLLLNGQVLVAGGHSGSFPFYTDTAELYDPANGTWTDTRSMAHARFEHTATLLPDGQVLVAGGFNIDTVDEVDNHPAQAELYDPASETWTDTGSMRTPRQDHTATLLPDGRVLIAGGNNGVNVLALAELYDPTSGTWSATGGMTERRTSFQATLLPNGRVLVEGGYDSLPQGSSRRLKSAELYDPASGTWKKTGSLAEVRSTHTATLLPNGQVLVAGGSHDDSHPLASAELYDPITGTWSTANNLGIGRRAHTATLLPDGHVLAAGGWLFGPITSVELFTSEGSAGITLINAVSRKVHGDAGTFDIDLPLSGTPGVECREGNGGPLLESIVFTFSEPVTSVSGVTTTSCGTVNSTNKKGLSVTVELGHVTGCDGSDITVSVHGVNGASSSVDASATMTLRTGDVNADGVVDRADLDEMRRHVGPVNSDNFRDDITVDGSVDRSDIKLERSKL